MNVDKVNAEIESLLGFPLSKYDDPNEKINEASYNLFRPAILSFFTYCNNPFKYRQQLYGIMTAIQKELKQYGLLDQYISKGLAPPKSDRYEEEWFNDLFGDKTYEPKFIIQGGEAVNYFSKYKNENVPTHDIDPRVCIGNFFHNLTDISELKQKAEGRKACTQLQKFRFFAAFGIARHIQFFVEGIKRLDNDNYTRFFLQNWTYYNQPIVEIAFSLNKEDLVNLVKQKDNKLLENIFIEGVMKIMVKLIFPGEKKLLIDLIDYAVPFARPRIGHSVSIHSYFSTEQTKFLTKNPGPLLEPGYTPYITVPMKFSDYTPVFKDYEITIIPLGYLLFDTFGMLLDTKIKEEEMGKSTKFIKYKQKLNVLLGTLIDHDISKAMLNNSYKFPTKNQEMKSYLVGGATKSTLTSNSMNLEKQLEEARYFSKLFFDMDAPKNLDTSKFTVEQLKGYYDYLSYFDPDYSEDSLPLSSEDAKQFTFVRLSEGSEHTSREPMPTPILSAPREMLQAYGGTRRTTQRKQSKYRHTQKHHK